MPLSRVGAKASVAGAILAVITSDVVMQMPRPKALELLAMLLASIAAVYVGCALSTEQRRHAVIEAIAASAFFVLAVLGLWLTPFLLVAGYLGHGIWDIAHHPRGIHTKIATWWPPFCLVYDWVVGTFLYWSLITGH